MQLPTLFALALLFLTLAAAAEQRARDLGVPFDGTPGPLDAITDVQGVEVGNATLISGEGPLKVGAGPVRTGVTVLFPRGKANPDPVYAGWFAQNGNGEMTGTTWLAESGFLESPIAITNTHSVGVVRDAIIAYEVKHSTMHQDWSLPVVAETWDGFLNDINGFHVHPEDVFAAMDNARSGPVPEGGVGGGTGMVCYGFKGGDGTASRVLPKNQGGYTVGVLVQCNCGRRPQLTIAGVPIGKEIPQQVPYAATTNPADPKTTNTGTPEAGAPFKATALGRLEWDDPSPNDTQSELRGDEGSIIIIVATDAPLLPTQLDRLARRATMGLARTGSTSGNGSGDIFLAFSTANPHAWDETPSPHTIQTIANERISPLFQATVEATEEAIVNALVAGKTMTGIDGHTVIGLPHDELKKALSNHGLKAGAPYSPSER